jgi:hypothetical protein
MAFVGAGAPVAVNAPAALDLPRATTHRPHWLHAQDRLWPETNCYVDLWIELLNAIGLDPMVAMAFLASAGFDGEQWTFFKYPPADLRDAYGLEVGEINVWRSVEEHVTVHLGLRHLLTVEADAWFLPDTEGVAHRVEHQKTTIAPLRIDPTGRRLTYLHNSGCFELSGDDYDGVLRGASPWPPYTECIDLANVVRRTDDAGRAVAEDLLVQHLARRPTANPVAQMADRIAADTRWLQTSSTETFHRYAFGTLRQCGAWAELFADFVSWLRPNDAVASATSLRALSAGAKTGQFKLARVAAGRAVDLSDLLAEMAGHWDDAYRALDDGR